MSRQHTSIPLGHILGIPIDLDYSWFLIFVLLTWTFAVGYYPAEFHNWPTAMYWALGAVTAVMLFVSVLLHELGHSVVAIHYQIPVRRITLFIFGGIAQIAAEPPSPSAEFLIAVAGPLVSLALMSLFMLLAPLSAPMPALWALFTYLAFINGALVVFNLIPGFPLDGGRVFRAIVWGITRNFRRATVIAGTLGRIVGFLFIFLGVWLIFGGNFINGLWIAFIGWFLESAAAAQIAQLQYRAIDGVLAAHKVSDAMNHNFVEVPTGLALQDLVENKILASGQRSFVVKQNGDVLGLLTLHRVKEVPPAQWPNTTAAQVMIPAQQMKRIGPDASLWDAIKEMDSDGVNQLPVMTDGHILGMLTREDIIGFLRTIQDFQGSAA
jgi:Zn-dependent protease/predicted transcriptional regulator